MRVQQSRTEVLPLTWEIPATIAACWLFLGLASLPAGQGAASWVSGRGFAWPDGQVVDSVLGILAGRPSVGIPHPPTTGLVYAAIVLAELLLGILASLALALWWRGYGPGAQHGLASRRQVAAVLGPANLGRRSAVIRPDLNAGRRDRTAGAW